MTAELLDQLGVLGDVLDDLSPPVQIEELTRRHAETGTVAVGEVASVDVVTPRPSARPRWGIRVAAMAAAAVMVVVLAAILRTPNRTTDELGSRPPQTTTPAALDPSGFPGSVWLATASTAAGIVEVVQSPDGLGICLWLTRDVPVYTAIVNGIATPGHADSRCTDASLVATGRLFAYFQSSGSSPGLLVGYTATDIGFEASVNGKTIRPDSHGLWYATDASGAGNFSIHTKGGPTDNVAVDPLSGPTFVATTTAPPTVPGSSGP